MRRRYRYDADLDAVVEVGNNFFEDQPKGPQLISDTLPGGVNGIRGMFHEDKQRYDSKSRYYSEIKDRGLAVAESGMVGEQKEPSRREYGEIVHRAFQQFDGNHNGMADRVRAEEKISAWKRENQR